MNEPRVGLGSVGSARRSLRLGWVGLAWLGIASAIDLITPRGPRCLFVRSLSFFSAASSLFPSPAPRALARRLRAPLRSLPTRDQPSGKRVHGPTRLITLCTWGGTVSADRDALFRVMSNLGELERMGGSFARYTVSGVCSFVCRSASPIFRDHRCTSCRIRFVCLCLSDNRRGSGKEHFETIGTRRAA